MSYSNMTENLGLPQYIGTDKPNWDIDTNEAYKKIDDFSKSVNEKDNGQDSEIGELQSITGRHTENLSQIAETLSTITNRLLENEGKVEALETDTEKLNRDVTDLQTMVNSHSNKIQELDESERETKNRLSTLYHYYEKLVGVSKFNFKDLTPLDGATLPDNMSTRRFALPYNKISKIDKIKDFYDDIGFNYNVDFSIVSTSIGYITLDSVQDDRANNRLVIRVHNNDSEEYDTTNTSDIFKITITDLEYME